MVGAMDGGWAAQDGRLTTNEDLLTGFANAIGYVWSRGFSRCHPATHLRLKPRFQRVIPKYQPFRRLSSIVYRLSSTTIDYRPVRLLRQLAQAAQAVVNRHFTALDGFQDRHLG